MALFSLFGCGSRTPDYPTDTFTADNGQQVKIRFFAHASLAIEAHDKHIYADPTESAAEYDPESRGGNPADGRKVKGATIHWVDAATAVDAEVRLYDNLFSDPDPDAAGKDFIQCLNPDSLEVLTGCKVEAGLADAQPSDRFQFLRQGYFCADSKDSRPGHLVFNRAVSLKDSFKP